jgi:hypothetical protein
MVSDPKGLDEWILTSACVARMSELSPSYRFYPGRARGDLENSIRAGRVLLRGRRHPDTAPEVFDEPITARHRIDLIHDTLSKRRPGPSDSSVLLLRDVEIEWHRTKAYLQAHAAEQWPIDARDDNAAPTPSTAGRPKRIKLIKDYVEQEQKAGRRPTQQGLEIFAHDRSYRGNREQLRSDFKRFQNAAGTPVRRGRPKKSRS